ncbi:Plasmodium vivax Vir protein, putative [Plasmodium vivax]|uniref:Vir protein, putative n=1 Tax=Plasmodium vivax TaxID=5855 RepID=A0A1G4ECX7_PLAVI|nr:Plasmodium vivax Vir protein, putative [Plasmodium vivax]
MQDHGNDKYYSIGHCKLLNYWLYDQVKKILGSDPKGKYKKIVKDLHSAWNQYNTKTILFKAKEKQCNPETTIPTLEEIEYKKLVHEHCLNYYNISNKQNNNVCQMYKNSIRGKSLSYEKFKSLFSEDKKEYPDYYKKCKSYNPIRIIAASQCPPEFAVDSDSEDDVPEEELKSASEDKHGVPTLEEGQSSLGGGVVTEGEQKLRGAEELSQEVEQSRIRDGRVEKIPRQGDARLEEAGVAKREVAEITGPKRDAPEPALAGDLHTESGHAQSRLTGLEMLHPKETGSLKGDDEMITSIDGDPNESIMQPKAGTIGATLAGSSLFLIMMYKYTPLGSWVSTRILGRNKLMENMKKNNYELLLNDVGNHDACLNDPMYHIRYNSATNH